MKSIQYKDHINLSNCADERIEFSGAIQPHGYSFVVDVNTDKVVFCSENINELIDISAEDFLKSSKIELIRFLCTDYDKFKNNPKVNSGFNLFITNDKTFNCKSTRDGDLILIELIYDPLTVETSSDLYNQVSHFIQLINKDENLIDFCQSISDRVKEITGLDRVMIYKFDDSYNGQVIAETKNDDLESFFQLHYPHTDIPPQARALYLKNHLRSIPDVNYKPVPILSLNEGDTNLSLDLSNSELRSVSPMHIEYLKNMKVGATLTISIEVKGRLWGLIACHHNSAKYLSHIESMAAKLHAYFLSSQIAKWEESEEYSRVKSKDELFTKLVNRNANENSILENLNGSEELFKITDSYGAAVIFDEDIIVTGKTPSIDQIREIKSHFDRKNIDTFYSDHFSNELPFAENLLEVASGILYMSLGAEMKSAIMWFRPEYSRTITWGGDPTIAKSHLKGQLTPRASFEKYTEEVLGRSKEWKNYQLQIAFRVLNYLQSEIYIQYLKNEKQRIQRLNEQLVQANDELEQFSWISSHDMKEPLRKIRVFTDLINEEGETLSDTSRDYFNRINSATEKMQSLINDLLGYARLNEASSRSEEDLTELVKTVFDKEQEETKKSIFSNISVLPTVDCTKFQMEQVFSNLVNNSIKFAKPDTALEIRMDSRELSAVEKIADGYDVSSKVALITYNDNGLGFNSSQKEKIFDMFRKLHDSSKYEGTGIGLAICKKIIESHGGKIRATGRENVGATFKIILPTI